MKHSIRRALRTALLVVGLVLVTACSWQTGTTPTPAGTSSATAEPNTAPTARVPATQLPATAVPTDAPPATAVPDAATAAIEAAIVAKFPGMTAHIQCVQGDYAAAVVLPPPGGPHGIGAYLRQQDGAWTIAASGLGIFREDLLALGFPDDFCGMPPAHDPTPPAAPAGSSPLVGPEWTQLVTGDLDRNGREDVVAFKAAPITPHEPAPGSRPGDVFVAFSELVVVERSVDGAPAVRLFLDTHAVLADNQEIARIPAASRPTSGVLGELRYPDRSIELRLIDDTGALGLPFLIVRYREDAGAYRAEAVDANRPALSIGALTISPSEPAQAGPESGPLSRLVQAGATVTLSIPVQGARQVTFFADVLGQTGHVIGGSVDPSGGRAELVWTVPEGAGQLSLYAQAQDGIGGLVASASTPVIVKGAGSSEYELPETLLRAYYKAVNAKDYQRAYGYWENPPSASFDEFVQGYADTASVAVLLGPNILEGAAGSQYARIPTVLAATSTQGGLKTFFGCYVARQTNADSDSSPHAGKWFLKSATIAEAPPNVSTKELLAQGCQA